MIEVITFEEATVEKLSGADVIMTIGWGDSQAPAVLLGRKTFANAAANREVAAATNIVRVKVGTDEEFEELKNRVKEAKGEQEPGEQEPGEPEPSEQEPSAE